MILVQQVLVFFVAWMSNYSNDSVSRLEIAPTSNAGHVIIAMILVGNWAAHSLIDPYST